MIIWKSVHKVPEENFFPIFPSMREDCIGWNLATVEFMQCFRLCVEEAHTFKAIEHEISWKFELFKQ
jgi:hypothetical protein